MQTIKRILAIPNLKLNYSFRREILLFYQEIFEFFVVYKSFSQNTVYFYYIFKRIFFKKLLTTFT